ncbi:MAG: hypothetical protein GY853_14020 [PVC group bacterium]|nr:hypothetical protein [PVC group bacterium]
MIVLNNYIVDVRFTIPGLFKYLIKEVKDKETALYYCKCGEGDVIEEHFRPIKELPPNIGDVHELTD